MEKILNFIKERMLEIAGLITVAIGISFLYLIFNYTPNNPTLIFPNDNEVFWLFKYAVSFTDFTLQAFGLMAFGIAINFCFLGVQIGIKKKISTSISFLLITLYLIFGSLFFKINNDQSFWLSTNGNGGFLGSYLLTLMSSFSLNLNIVTYASAVLALIFFILSFGLSVSNWKNIFKTIYKPFAFLKSKILNHQSNSQDQELETFETQLETETLKVPKSQEFQSSLPLQESTKLNSFEYKMPSISFLKEPDSPTSDTELSDSFEKQSKFLEDTLLDFGIMGKIKRVSAGPVVTLYEFEPAAGIKTSKIINLSDDIARSTSSIATRVATVPGKNTIGIEIPNKNIEPVYLKEILSSKEFVNKNIRLPITLGKSISGYPIVGDLVSMPHLLIAGTTGSGKSVCINTLILSILYRHKPEHCKLILIDPKMLELSIYQG
ncbi:DNA translocase FtsK, partial [Pelagibacteraceae bacterium]|nr:DNA translocase FtsK [Pelagibacteraceae bacterium]